MSEVSLAEKKAELRLLQRRQQMQDENGLIFYKPHPKQELFHEAAHHIGRYARTGNRFGKSEMGAAEDCSWALGERLWYTKNDPRRYVGIPKHATKGLIICQDWDKVTEIFTSQERGKRAGKIFRFLPKASIVRTKKNHSGHIDRIVITSIWGGESIIMFDTVKSFKVNPQGSESSDWDWIHIDEPIPQAMWRAVSRGLMDRDGHYWFTCTPLCEMWINDLFIPGHLLRSELNKPLTGNQGDTWVMTGKSTDNPFVTKAAINRFMEKLPEDERACRLEGIPTALSGVVYKQYDPTKHIYHDKPIGWKNVLEPPKDYTYRISIDPHPKTPHAVLFAATSPLGQTFFWKEIFSPLLIKDLCSLIAEILDGRRLHRAICDPIAWIRNPMTGFTMADEFWKNGIPVEPASKELAYGILRTQEALKTPDNLYFHTACVETKKEFDHYTWKPDTEKPIDKDDHMMECLYRLVLDGLTYEENSNFPVAPKPQNFRNVRVKPINTTRALRGTKAKKQNKSYLNPKNRYKC